MSGVLNISMNRHYRRFLRDANLSDQNSTAQRVLITLVESGFLYCLGGFPNAENSCRFNTFIHGFCPQLTQVDLFIPADYAYTFKFLIQGFFGPLGDQISVSHLVPLPFHDSQS